MNAFLRRSATFLHEDDGPTATEYGVLIAIICIAVIGALSQFGNKMTNIYTAVTGVMPASTAGS